MDYHCHLKKGSLETEEEAQWSGAVDLYEGSNLTATQVPGDPTPLQASAGIRHTWYTYIHTGKTSSILSIFFQSSNFTLLETALLHYYTVLVVTKLVTLPP